MTARCRSLALGLAVAGGALACGGIEPAGPNGPWPTTIQTESDGCTPEGGEHGSAADVETGADTSGSDGATTTTSAAAEVGEDMPCTTGECMPGLEGCPCTAGGACDPGLMCISDVCVEMPCPVGTEGCPCTQGGACDPGLTCVAGECG